MIRPPASRLGPADAEVIARYLQNSPVGAAYTQSIDRESAYELLQKRSAEKANDDARSAQNTASGKEKKSAASSSRQGVGEALLKSVVRSVGSSVGRQIAKELLRGVLGSLKR